MTNKTDWSKNAAEVADTVSGSLRPVCYLIIQFAYSTMGFYLELKPRVNLNVPTLEKHVRKLN
jgi:hypothetical protein